MNMTNFVKLAVNSSVMNHPNCHPADSIRLKSSIGHPFYIKQRLRLAINSTKR